jgi:hypothetical protein
MNTGTSSRSDDTRLAEWAALLDESLPESTGDGDERGRAR